MAASRWWGILALGLLVASCGSLGSGDLIEEERSLGSFEGLDISEGIHVELTVDPGARQSVTVHYDDNLVDRIVTDIRGGTLHIEFDGIVTTGGGDRAVVVVTDTVDRISVSGGAELFGSGFIAEYELRASGGADANLRALTAERVVIDASGGANVWVFASESADGKASGGSDVSIYGDPDRGRIRTSGGADVEYEE